MSEMVERVARAISLWSGDDWNGFLGSRECSRNRYRAMARAAIEAMREPTEAMLHATWDYSPGPECQCMSPGVYVEWKTMIDEALK